MLAFANYGRTLPDNAIQQITLGVGSGANDFGEYDSIYDPSVQSTQDVIIPDCAQIQPVVNRIFQLGDKQSCNVNG
jgi:hypothetical protein